MTNLLTIKNNPVGTLAHYKGQFCMALCDRYKEVSLYMRNHSCEMCMIPNWYYTQAKPTAKRLWTYYNYANISSERKDPIGL